ncbi:MAG: hypothetical protein NTY17_02650 [Planctomycetia bacterium]|nr:hypothetical protein [Planctomycetia bacterium]
MTNPPDHREWHRLFNAALNDELNDAASRQLVKAIYTDGVQVVDVARRQGCAPKTISNKLTFIRRALAECVQRRMAEAARTA